MDSIRHVRANPTASIPDPLDDAVDEQLPLQLFHSVLILCNTLGPMLEMAGRFGHRELRGSRIRRAYPRKEARRTSTVKSRHYLAFIGYMNETVFCGTVAKWLFSE